MLQYYAFEVQSTPLIKQTFIRQFCKLFCQRAVYKAKFEVKVKFSSRLRNFDIFV